MTDSACPLPSAPLPDENDAIERMLKSRRIAVVGLSTDALRPSNEVSSYLLENGYDIVPVNPAHGQVLGRKCYRLLSEVPGPIDVALVFRRSEHAADVVRQAVDAGVRGVWLQAGITSEEGRRVAQEAGIDFVQNRCMMVEHRRRGYS